MQQSIGQKNVKNIQSTSSPAVISLISIIFHFELNHYSLNEVSMIFQKAWITKLNCLWFVQGFIYQDLKWNLPKDDYISYKES